MGDYVLGEAEEVFHQQEAVGVQAILAADGTAAFLPLVVETSDLRKGDDLSLLTALLTMMAAKSPPPLPPEAPDGTNRDVFLKFYEKLCAIHAVSHQINVQLRSSNGSAVMGAPSPQRAAEPQVSQTTIRHILQLARNAYLAIPPTIPWRICLGICGSTSSVRPVNQALIIYLSAGTSFPTLMH